MKKLNHMQVLLAGILLGVVLTMAVATMVPTQQDTLVAFGIDQSSKLPMGRPLTLGNLLACMPANPLGAVGGVPSVVATREVRP